MFLLSFPRILLFLLASVSLRAADEQTRLDVSHNLFTVMAALQAGGLVQVSENPYRAAVARHLAQRPDLQVISEIANFIKTHPQSRIPQYLSFALATTEAPEFHSRFQVNEIPPDVMALEGFDGLMSRFERDSGIGILWAKLQPQFEKELARYQVPVSTSLLEANGYLRNVTSGYMGRSFIVFLDMLGPPGQVQSRSYADDYFLVLSPANPPDTSLVRHAYLHYLLDPLMIKYSEPINKKISLSDYAQGAPALDASYKSDFLLLTVECLIRAIESRLLHGTPEARKELVDRSLAEGYVMTPAFAELLPAYEKQDVAMRLYLPDLVALIDLKKENRRLDKIEFAANQTGPQMDPSRTRTVPLTSAQTALDFAEKLLYVDKELGKAHEVYLKVLSQTEDKTLHARAYYGLGRIAALERNPELAERLFSKSLELTPDAQTRSWSEVYLGRLSEAAGDRPEAAKHFKAALAVDGASAAALKAAEQGLAKLPSSSQEPTSLHP